MFFTGSGSASGFELCGDGAAAPGLDGELKSGKRLAEMVPGPEDSGIQQGLSVLFFPAGFADQQPNQQSGDEDGEPEEQSRGG